MAFGKMGIRAWSREWRMSDWRETIPLASGRECPRPGCKATICGGSAWRDHWAGHEQADERLEEMHQQIVTLSRAVRILAGECGHDDWYEHAEEPGEEAPLSGYVLGNGPLPAETRGGGE